MPAIDGWYRLYNPSSRATYSSPHVPVPDEGQEPLVVLEGEDTHDVYGALIPPEYDVDPPKSKSASKSASKTEEVSK